MICPPFSGAILSAASGFSPTETHRLFSHPGATLLINDQEGPEPQMTISDLPSLRLDCGVIMGRFLAQQELTRPNEIKS